MHVLLEKHTSNRTNKKSQTASSSFANTHSVSLTLTYPSGPSVRIRGICEPPGILDAVNKEFSSPYIFNEWIEVVIDQNVVFHRRKPSEGIANERGVEKGPHHAWGVCFTGRDL